ncbi:MAG: hypothetical protein HW416_2249 [Chloroflexi bacterium]|nr:hypothetical protein [Chloroflexota bacterium]
MAHQVRPPEGVPHEPQLTAELYDQTVASHRLIAAGVARRRQSALGHVHLRQLPHWRANDEAEEVATT